MHAVFKIFAKKRGVTKMTQIEWVGTKIMADVMFYVSYSWPKSSQFRGEGGGEGVQLLEKVHGDRLKKV